MSGDDELDAMFQEIPKKDTYPFGKCAAVALKGLTSCTYEEAGRRLAMQSDARLKSMGLMALARCIASDWADKSKPTVHLIHGRSTISLPDGRNLNYLALVQEAVRIDKDNVLAVGNLKIFFHEIIQQLCDRDRFPSGKCKLQLLSGSDEASVGLKTHRHRLVRKSTSGSIVCNICMTHGCPGRSTCNAGEGCDYDACGTCVVANAHEGELLTYEQAALTLVGTSRNSLQSYGLFALARCMGSVSTERLSVKLASGNTGAFSYEELLLEALRLYPENEQALQNLGKFNHSEAISNKDKYPWGNCKGMPVTANLTYEQASMKLLQLPYAALQSMGLFGLSRCAGKNTLQLPDGRVLTEREMLKEAMRLNPQNKLAKHNLENDECSVM